MDQNMLIVYPPTTAETAAADLKAGTADPQPLATTEAIPSKEPGSEKS